MPPLPVPSPPTALEEREKKRLYFDPVNSMSNPASAYDVVIIGGALSGAGTAILLLREQPKLRVLIIEKSAAFTRKVGEATVEISTYFLTHSLGLARHLNESHLNKQGLRFWFANDRAKTMADCSEIGPGYLARVPAYLVDRAVLDEEVLRRACALGAELWRTASVQKIELVPGGNQKITVRYQERVEQIESRWVATLYRRPPCDAGMALASETSLNCIAHSPPVGGSTTHRVERPGWSRTRWKVHRFRSTIRGLGTLSTGRADDEDSDREGSRSHLPRGRATRSRQLQFFRCREGRKGRLRSRN